MAILQDKIQPNYNRVLDILSSRYEEINGYDFYNFIFPYNEVAGDIHYDYSRPNAIFLYTAEDAANPNRNLSRRVMLQDTWEEDYMNYVECNDKALCSGLAFRGRVNRLEHAQQMNALIFDLDSVGENELMTLFKRLSDVDGLRRMPYPTFIVQSGSGLHIYYVFDEPIPLFPNIKLQLKALKHDLTFKLWDYKGTTQEKNIQYQPLNQAFRMVGSHNNKYDLQVRAFRTGETVSIEHLNQFVMEEHN